MCGDTTSMCEVMARRGLEVSEGLGQVRTLTRELAKAKFGCLRREAAYVVLGDVRMTSLELTPPPPERPSGTVPRFGKSKDPRNFLKRQPHKLPDPHPQL